VGGETQLNLKLTFLSSTLHMPSNTHNSIMELAGNATRLFYLSEEGKEGRNAFLQKRKPAFRSLPTSKL